MLLEFRFCNFKAFRDETVFSLVASTDKTLQTKRVWQQATRPNALFLSTAIQLNSDSLRPLFDWFATALHVYLDGGTVTPDHSIAMVETEGRTREVVLDMVTGEVKPSTREGIALTPQFEHRAGGSSVRFSLGDESLGTQKLFALAGRLHDVLEKGSILVIDELDRSLHPLLVRQIIEMFQDPGTNPKGAQLICTTHDTTLLDSTLLRRDQIWFVETAARQAATVVPLTDFSPRKNEAFERSYLSGRYRAIPILGRRLVPEDENGKE